MKGASRVRTSRTDPLLIRSVAAPGGGLIGMTFCPGKQQTGAASGTWARDLALDLAVIRDWGAVAVLTLMEAAELREYGVAHIGEAVEQLGMEWHHAAIPDADIPGRAFAKAWPESGLRLRQHLANGRNVVLHCRGGLGRTGMIAACLLAEMGVPPSEAVRRVRTARPGAIETAAQKAYVLATCAVAEFRAAADSPVAGRDLHR